MIAPRNGVVQEREDSILKSSASQSKSSSGLFSVHFTHRCAACDSHAKSVKREFSDQAWAALVTWNEISSTFVDAPMCNDCYLNFRDVLIERADEVRFLASNRSVSSRRKNEGQAARA
jgi:hypothetical protein